ncbi:MAG: RNA 2',3'-cyclic phosphodiesterase [Sphingomonadaceae bacterium]
MHRLFVAIRPPRSIRTSLLSIMEGVEGARWQDDDQLHLTLRYIGRVDSRMAEDIAVMLGSISTARFDLSLSGVGTFAHRGRIDTLWAGVTPHAPLVQLHRKIDHLVANISGEAEHRAYQPHITIARFGRVQQGIAAFIVNHAGLASAPFAITEFGLFESHIESSGARYEAIATYPLR